MDKNEHDVEQRFMKLIDESSPMHSNLAIRCQEDAVFRRNAALMIDALRDFYTRMNKDALQCFESRLCQWIKHPSSYIGFFGELRVADQLREWGVVHQFMREIQGINTPDMRLTVTEREVYFEVKTLQENLHTQFFKEVRDKVDKLNLGISNIAVRKIKITANRFETLVDVAVRLIEGAVHNNRESQIKFKGEEGEFYIYVSFATPVGQKPTGSVFSWPESRLRADNTPWAQSVLEERLRDNIGQFQSNKPTFLVWVSLDVLLPDLETHATQVLQRLGQTTFVDVAGIIIFDSYHDSALIENQCEEHSTVEYVGLFNSIRSLISARKTPD